MNFKTNVTGFVYTLLVGRLGLGALSWVRIGLADKIKVSVSWLTISAYSAVFPRHLGGVAPPQYKSIKDVSIKYARRHAGVQGWG